MKLGCFTSLRLTILVSKAAACNDVFPLIFKQAAALSKLNSVARGIIKDVAEVS